MKHSTIGLIYIIVGGILLIPAFQGIALGVLTAIMEASTETAAGYSIALATIIIGSPILLAIPGSFLHFGTKLRKNPSLRYYLLPPASFLLLGLHPFVWLFVFFID